jgi:hypothetical protein
MLLQGYGNGGRFLGKGSNENVKENPQHNDTHQSKDKPSSGCQASYGFPFLIYGCIKEELANLAGKARVDGGIAELGLLDVFNVCAILDCLQLNANSLVAWTRNSPRICRKVPYLFTFFIDAPPVAPNSVLEARAGRFQEVSLGKIAVIVVNCVTRGVSALFAVV